RFRPQIVEALGQTGPAGLGPLIKLVEDEDSAVRAVAVRSLGRAGRGVAGAVPALVKSLRDKDPQVRHEAILEVGQIGTAAQAAIPALTDVLKGEQVGDRILAAEALAHVDPRSQLAVT